MSGRGYIGRRWCVLRNARTDPGAALALFLAGNGGCFPGNGDEEGGSGRWDRIEFQSERSEIRVRSIKDNWYLEVISMYDTC